MFHPLLLSIHGKVSSMLQGIFLTTFTSEFSLRMLFICVFTLLSPPSCVWNSSPLQSRKVRSHHTGEANSRARSGLIPPLCSGIVHVRSGVTNARLNKRSQPTPLRL